MSPTRSATAVLLMTSFLVAGVAGARLERLGEFRSEQDPLLYLPNGKYLKVASLGQASLLADLIYLWAIQYYSNYQQGDRYRYVEHVFGEVIAELDPHYVDPYWVGALILTVEAQDLEAGLRLLDQGFSKNPDRWILPYLAGWECYHAGDAERAASYFQTASGVPGAPAAVRRIQAGLANKAGDLRGALARWVEVRDDPGSDEQSITIAKRQIRGLQRRADIAELQSAVDRFRIENQRFPASLEELQQRAYISRVPRDPGDREYQYDPVRGRVASPGTRVLKDS